MSEYHVCMTTAHNEVIKTIKFDNKEDAEHYAKNQSIADEKHSYSVQKNNKGEFSTIKSYLKGQEL